VIDGEDFAAQRYLSLAYLDSKDFRGVVDFVMVKLVLAVKRRGNVRSVILLLMFSVAHHTHLELTKRR